MSHSPNPVKGGKGDSLDFSAVDQEQLRLGTKHEMEHTKDPKVARDIAMDHLAEDPEYYSHLKESTNPWALAEATLLKEEKLDDWLAIWFIQRPLDNENIEQFLVDMANGLEKHVLAGVRNDRIVDAFKRLTKEITDASRLSKKGLRGTFDVSKLDPESDKERDDFLNRSWKDVYQKKDPEKAKHKPIRQYASKMRDPLATPAGHARKQKEPKDEFGED